MDTHAHWCRSLQRDQTAVDCNCKGANPIKPTPPAASAADQIEELRRWAGKTNVDGLPKTSAAFTAAADLIESLTAQLARAEAEIKAEFDRATANYMRACQAEEKLARAEAGCEAELERMNAAWHSKCESLQHRLAKAERKLKEGGESHTVAGQGDVHASDAPSDGNSMKPGECIMSGETAAAFEAALRHRYMTVHERVAMIAERDAATRRDALKEALLIIGKANSYHEAVKDLKRAAQQPPADGET